MSNAGKVATVATAAPIGYEGTLIEVECDMKAGLPSLQIVGMGSKAIDEARERVRSAISNSHLDFPAKKFVINLAPAELPKDGSHYDVAIALSILISSGQLLQQNVTGCMFAGELGLDGRLRPVGGIISITEVARDNGYKTVFLPKENAAQASLVAGITIIPIDSITDLFLHLKAEKVKSVYKAQLHSDDFDVSDTSSTPVLDDILGQEQAKRALVIAAAGHHNILLTGSPGAGKTMLARVLPGLLPALTPDERVAVTKLHSLSGVSIATAASRRPFRSPHHTSSRISLVGGGNPPKPGDISLAHHGVLFLDEIPEYPRATLEALRQPLEDRSVSIARANGHATYPADFMLIATMNPCPCGYYGDSKRECSCSSNQIVKYQQRLSGPLLDRIDLVVNVNRIKNDELTSHKKQSSTAHHAAKQSIDRALSQQINRYSRSNHSNIHNSALSSKDIASLIPLSTSVRQLLIQATDRLNLSARGYFKVIKVARTIADLDQSEDILAGHVAEALQYRLIS